MLDRRLRELSACLEGKDYLEDRFTAGDLITSAVLRQVTPETMARFPILDAYRKRCEARPAFGRALAAQLADFSDDPPK
jgi:glutathione S-transferase